MHAKDFADTLNKKLSMLFRLSRLECIRICLNIRIKSHIYGCPDRSSISQLWMWHYTNCHLTLLKKKFQAQERNRIRLHFCTVNSYILRYFPLNLLSISILCEKFNCENYFQTITTWTQSSMSTWPVPCNTTSAGI